MTVLKATIDMPTLELLAINEISQCKRRGDKYWGAAWAYRDVADRLFGDKAKQVSERLWKIINEKAIPPEKARPKTAGDLYGIETPSLAVEAGAVCKRVQLFDTKLTEDCPYDGDSSERLGDQSDLTELLCLQRFVMQATSKLEERVSEIVRDVAESIDPMA